MKLRTRTVSFSCQIARCVLLLSLMAVSVCHGQNRGARGMVSFGSAAGLADDTLYLDINQDIAVQLLPFDDLLKIAVSRSPLIKYQDEVANSLGEAEQVAKAQIWQNVAGFGNYSAGNQSLVTTGVGQGAPAQGSSLQLANGYRAGVNVQFTLFDLFGRKHLIRQAASNHKAAVLQKETIELQLKRELITIYQDMITTQQLLKILLIDEQASLTALRVGEASIQKGQITADALASTTSRYVQAKTASEQIKGSFLKNVRYFEALMGMPIQRLKRN